MKNRETLASLKAELTKVQNEKHQLILANERLAMEYEGLKSSFHMVKKNYEREKNRLDGVIKTMFNQSKPK
jgi:regulator of replication initiation timing